MGMSIVVILLIILIWNVKQGFEMLSDQLNEINLTIQKNSQANKE